MPNFIYYKIPVIEVKSLLPPTGLGYISSFITHMFEK